MPTTKNHQQKQQLSPKKLPVSRREIISLKAKEAMKRTWLERYADALAESLGTITFFVLNLIWFGIWMVFNSGVFENVKPFDPFPFNFLTMVVSLEAIFLSIIVLISQNRAAKIDELRQEIDLQVNTISEQEITKIMQMLSKIMEHTHLKTSGDSTLKEMLKPIDVEKIESDLNKQM